MSQGAVKGAFEDTVTVGVSELSKVVSISKATAFGETVTVGSEPL